MRYTTRKPRPAAGTGNDARLGPGNRGAARARQRPGHPALTQLAWRRASEWPLLAAAVLFLAAYSFQVIANLPEARSGALEAVIWITWAAFGVDYAMNLLLAPHRGRWFLRNLHELLIVVLPVLRPLRLLRLLTLLQLMHRAAGSALRGRIIAYVLSAAALLTYAGALAALDVEQNTTGANITTFGDALWWAVATITTVGYGDFYPVTQLGRFVAAGLMIGGIAVLGIVTAAVASWLVENVAAETAAELGAAEAPIHEELTRLTARIEELTARIEELTAPSREHAVAEHVPPHPR
jgi:voltage-gated potassium channel